MGGSGPWSGRPPADKGGRFDHGITHDSGSEQTAALVLANLEHELRVPRDSVRLRAAECEREPDLRDLGREGREHPATLDRGAGDGASRPADRRVPERPYLEPPGPPASVLFDMADSPLPAAPPHAHF